MKVQDVAKEECFGPNYENLDSDEFWGRLGVFNNTTVRVIAVMGLIGKMQRARIDKKLEYLDLTGPQMDVLFYLINSQDRESEVTAKELEQMFRVSNPTMSGILKRLEKKGFIERTPGKLDKRNKQIRVKGDIQKFYNIIEKEINVEKSNIFNGFTQEELEVMLKLLMKLLRNLDKDKKEE